MAQPALCGVIYPDGWKLPQYIILCEKKNTQEKMCVCVCGGGDAGEAWKWAEQKQEVRENDEGDENCLLVTVQWKMNHNLYVYLEEFCLVNVLILGTFYKATS